MKTKQVYLNPKQLAFACATQPSRVWIGGRGSGKTGMIGVSQRQKMGDLPRAKFFFSSSTYGQLLTKTLPPITKIWENFGLIEHIPGQQNGHYVIGKIPPRTWVRPYDTPRKYNNVITFRNGYTIELLSMDRPEIARGGSYDGGEIDEAALVKQDVLSQVLLPSIRGNGSKFKHWSHGQLSMYTSRPWRADGLYLNDYEDKAKLSPDEYFYQESTAWDNEAILGKKSLLRMKSEMPGAIYAIEIMNEKHGKSEICFYHAWDDTKHTYGNAYDYDEDDLFGIAIKSIKNIDTDLMIDISCDFGGWFTGFTVWQEDMRKNTEYCKDAFYVPEDKGITQLVDNFCAKYKDHRYKFIKIWGEPRGHDKNATGFTYYEQMEQRFRHHGWHIEICVNTAVSENHENRYEFVNVCLDESNPDLPKVRMNADTCKDVVISIHNTEVDNNFKKIKKNEKNRSYNQAHATHYTDTFDYYLMQKHGWKFHMYGLSGGAGMVVFR